VSLVAPLLIFPVVWAQATATPDSTSAAISNKPTPESSSGQSHKKTDGAKKARSTARHGQTYTGATGKKPNSSTICATPRTTQSGQVDCGVTGDAATNGHIVTKPR
jgi:hypothetical protein